MANYNFKKDLPLGNEGEDVVINDLIKASGKQKLKVISKNNDNKFDFIVERKGKHISYEVKTDVFCKPDYDTGNMFIEFECRNKPSGIAVSKADYFVTYYKHLNEIWYIKKDELLNIIERDANFIRKTEFSGDKNSNTKGWLLPRENYMESFKVRKL